MKHASATLDYETNTGPKPRKWGKPQELSEEQWSRALRLAGLEEEPPATEPETPFHSECCACDGGAEIVTCIAYDLAERLAQAVLKLPERFRVDVQDKVIEILDGHELECFR